MTHIYRNFSNLIATIFASITGSRGLHGKPINISNNLGFNGGLATSSIINGGNISIRRSYRTTNQRKRRKHFRAQLANGSV